MANKNGTTKAQVTAVQIGTICIEGLMLPDGSFGVAVPQIADIALNKCSRNKASRYLKRVCKKHDLQIEWEEAKTIFNKFPLFGLGELRLVGKQPFPNSGMKRLYTSRISCFSMFLCFADVGYALFDKTYYNFLSLKKTL